jgi:hypothetical protein
MVLHKYIVDADGVKQTCIGPHELQAWVASGRVQSSARVCDLATGVWHDAGQLLQHIRSRSEVERCADIQATLSRLKYAAEALVETLRSDRSKEPGSIRSHSGAACDDDDVNTNEPLESAGIAV